MGLRQSSQLYDVNKTFEDNQKHKIVIPQKVSFKNSNSAVIFGKKINSRFGVPACPITIDAQRIGFLAAKGFDIITMKSRRSESYPGNSYPNWVYVDASNQLKASDLKKPLVGRLESFTNQEISTANSFGVASESPASWIKEFEKAKVLLHKGQLLILSVMPTVSTKFSLETDVLKLAEIIKKTSASEVELNLACPNTGGHNLIYQDLEMSAKLLHLIKSKLPKLNIIAKIGYYSDKDELKQFLQQNQDCLSGISSTNTYSMKIIDSKGDSLFGKDRETAGVSGAAIRDLSIQQAASLVKFRNDLSLQEKLYIIGVGGVVKPEDIDLYLTKANVDAVQSAVGAWMNSNLAIDYRQLHSNKV